MCVNPTQLTYALDHYVYKTQACLSRQVQNLISMADGEEDVSDIYGRKGNTPLVVRMLTISSLSNSDESAMLAFYRARESPLKPSQPNPGWPATSVILAP